MAFFKNGVSHGIYFIENNIVRLIVDNSPVAIQDDPDIDYIWVFISFYVSRGNRGPKKPNLPFPSVGQIFL